MARAQVLEYTKAEVLAIGPWKSAFDGLFGRRVGGFASEIPDGEMVVISVTGVSDVPGSNDRKEKLAEALGVGLWDFGKHALDPEKIDLDGFRRVHELENDQDGV